MSPDPEREAAWLRGLKRFVDKLTPEAKAEICALATSTLSDVKMELSRLLETERFYTAHELAYEIYELHRLIEAVCRYK